jgi:hypothetical protein
MDKASILGDAVEFVKELTQKISNLQKELESPPSTSFHLVSTSPRQHCSVHTFSVFALCGLSCACESEQRSALGLNK